MVSALQSDDSSSSPSPTIPLTLPPQTSTNNALAILREIAKILTIYKQLASHPDLKPCAEVNTLFNELMAICLKPTPTSTIRNILENEEVKRILPALHALCSKAEYEMECFWSEKIIRGIDAEKELHSFWYYQNYEDLTRLELAALHAVDPKKPTNIAFIGSGPLPLTSLCLLRQLNARVESENGREKGLWEELEVMDGKKRRRRTSEEVTVLNIDRCSKAVEMGRSLCHALGARAKGMQFLVGKAETAITTLNPATKPPTITANTHTRNINREGIDTATALTNTIPLPQAEQDLSKHDVVFLAALVGNTQAEKEKILKDVVRRMGEGALVVIRSVEGLRGLCYPVFDPTTQPILDCLDICLIAHPFTEVVNSVVVGRVKKRS